MELDLGLASSFLVLAEEGHYGRAAARLHVTSPGPDETDSALGTTARSRFFSSAALRGFCG